ncbi:MAG: hypothetical protein AB7M12_08655 [Hyphomonadaceae bacterium]
MTPLTELQVFRLRLPRHEFLVAAHSRAEAAAAWGVCAGVFLSGLAKEVHDDWVALARARSLPGRVLRRRRGTMDPYRRTPAGDRAARRGDVSAAAPPAGLEPATP